MKITNWQISRRGVINTGYYLAIAVFVLAFLLAISSRLNIPGNFRAYSVLTGSMEPKIPTGSLIITKAIMDVSDIKQGDVITFIQPGYENKYITHRVERIEKSEMFTLFRTKGDANPVDDGWLISYGAIQGNYQVGVPYLGYLLEFLKSPIGIALFIVLPALYLIGLELKNIGSILMLMNFEKSENNTKSKKGDKKKIKNKNTKVIAVVIMVMILLNTNVFPTYALLTTTPIEISANSLSTGSWGNPGDVVINEIMWSGSSSSTDDEWIELRNMTSSAIDMAGWSIDGAGSGASAISLTGTIGANSFFLISNNSSNVSAMSDTIVVDQVTSSIEIDDSLEQLTLRNSLNSPIDQTPSSGGSWAAGSQSPNFISMERNDTPSSGTSAGSWHGCIDSGCNSLIYWDSIGSNFGTPKFANLSTNDPTSPDYLDDLLQLKKNEASSSASLVKELMSEKKEASDSANPNPSPSPTPSLTPNPSSSPENQGGEGQNNPTPIPSVEPQQSPSPTPSTDPDMSTNPSPSPTPEPSSSEVGNDEDKIEVEVTDKKPEEETVIEESSPSEQNNP